MSNPTKPNFDHGQAAGRDALAGYTSFEISAVKYDGPDAIITTHDTDSRAFAFGLYGRDREGLARWISDYPTRADAVVAMSALRYAQSTAAAGESGEPQHPKP